MATTRLAVVLLVLGAVVVLVVQNLAPTLPLVLLGGRTLALPLGVWMAAAIGLGALTTLVLMALLGTIGRGGSGSRRYKYEPQAFYEPASPSTSASDAAADTSTSPRSASADYRRSSAPRSAPPRSAPEPGGEWQAWTNLQSPAQWNDWETLSQTPRPEAEPAARRASSWFGGQPKADPSQQANESLREIAEDWGDLERRSYRAPGVSPVEDSLDELNQGWDDLEPSQAPTPPPRDFEARQSPTQVYRDGSIYSYSYQDRASAGQTDNIYAPADESPDDEFAAEADLGNAPQSLSAEEYDTSAPDPNDDDFEPLDDANVVDADYRVIIPPYNPPSPDPSTP